MKDIKQTLDALRLKLALEAIAIREGVPISEVQSRAHAGESEFVRAWITEHYFELGGF